MVGVSHGRAHRSMDKHDLILTFEIRRIRFTVQIRSLSCCCISFIVRVRVGCRSRCPRQYRRRLSSRNDHLPSPVLYNNTMPLNAEEDRQASVRTYIDSTLTDLFNQLSLPPAQAQPSITLRCRASPTSCVFNRVTGALETRQDVKTLRTYSWPGDTAYESWKFSMRLSTVRSNLVS